LRQQLEYLKLVNPFNLIWGWLYCVYGEGQSKNSLFPFLVAAALRRDRVFNISGGKQLREYLSVEEVSRQIVQLAMAQRDIGSVNICSRKPISVRRLVG